MTLVPLLAHQGGWDEILLVVGPLAVVGGLLWLANRRVAAQLEGGAEADGTGSGSHHQGTGSHGPNAAEPSDGSAGSPGAPSET